MRLNLNTIMSILKLKLKLFNYYINYILLPELTTDEIISSHKTVTSAIIKLKDVLPKKYTGYNLISSIMPKAYGYNTALDENYYQYTRIKKALKLFLQNEYLSRKISYRLILLKKSKLDKWSEDKRNELDIKYLAKSEKVDFERLKKYKYNNYNVFFASAQAYLRVITLYMEKSDSSKNILIVPQFLNNCEILKNIDTDSLFYFEDFITDEIFEKYITAKKDFSDTYENKKYLLNDIFNLDSNNFFKLIQIGLQNIFQYLLPQAYLFSLVYEEVFRRINVKNVIGIRVRKIYDRSLYETAMKNNIRRYVLLHSNIGGDIRDIHSMGHFNNITGVFAWSEKQKQIIQNDVFSNVENVFVTGSPLFEYKKNQPKHLISNNTTKTILYAAGMPDIFELSKLVEVVKHFNCKLIIKVHPGEKSFPYRHFVSTNISLVEGEKILEDLLPHSDILVTTISGSSFHAMLCGVPTLMLVFTAKNTKLMDILYDFDDQEEQYTVVCTKKEMQKKLELLLTDVKYNHSIVAKQSEILNRRINMQATKNGSVNIIENIINNEVLDD